MDLADVDLLAGPAGQELVARVRAAAADQARTGRMADPVAQVTALRGAGHPAELVAAALTQARLQDDVAARTGTDWPTGWLLTPDSAQQLTRPVVARWRAQRLAAAGVTDVVDLTAGAGGDTVALADAGLRVLAVDADPVVAACLQHTVTALGVSDRVRVLPATAQDVTVGGAAVADPARRRAGRRVTDPDQWSPPLSWLAQSPIADLAVKVAPGLDRKWVAAFGPPGAVDVDYVSADGDLVEAAIYRGRLHRAGRTRSATIIRGAAVAATLDDRDEPAEPPFGPLTGVLLEPDPAVVRSGLVAAAAVRLGAHLVDPQLAYLAADRPPAEPALASGYRIDEVVPFSVKRLRAALVARDIGRVVVKKRAFAMTPEQVVAALRLDRSCQGTATVVLLRLGAGRQARPYAVITTPLAAVGEADG